MIIEWADSSQELDDYKQFLSLICIIIFIYQQVNKFMKIRVVTILRTTKTWLCEHISQSKIIVSCSEQYSPKARNSNPNTEQGLPKKMCSSIGVLVRKVSKFSVMGQSAITASALTQF